MYIFVYFCLNMTKEEIQKERAAFYNRLLEKSDEELLKGGISRLQVVEALNTVLLHKSGGS